MSRSPWSPTIDLTQEFRSATSTSSIYQKNGISSPLDRDLEKGISPSESEEGSEKESGSGLSYIQEFEIWQELHDKVKALISKMNKTSESIKKLHTQALMNNI